MMRSAWIIAALAGIGLGLWQAWPDEPEEKQAASATREASPATAQRAASSAIALPSNWPPALPGAAAEPSRVPLLPLEHAVPAAQSMAEARESGDPRTPPIERDTHVAEKPTAAELADPAAYQQFEARQHMRELAAFTQAAALEVPRLREDIERGRAAGIPPDEIAKAEEKARRIDEMRERLQQQYPQLRR